MQAINLTNSSTKNKRRELDYYPTPPEVTRVLIEFLHDEGVVECASTIWEPACGDGAMSKIFESYGYKVISSDIRDTGYGQNGIDFLTTTHLEASMIVTNPPFNDSEQFISHSLELGADVVALLLKSQYWHASKRTKLFEKYHPAYVLALNWRPDFMNGERGGSPTMECLWTVWIRGKTDTRYRILQKPKS